jgi:hypothetical protein
MHLLPKETLKGVSILSAAYNKSTNTVQLDNRTGKRSKFPVITILHELFKNL